MRIYDRDSIVVCVQVRPATGAPCASSVAVKESSREVPRHGSGPRCIGPGRRAGPASAGSVRYAMTAFREVLHGEFDPGSGRTLAACLTHASGATNQGLPWGRAANGRVTRGLPDSVTGTTRGNSG